MSSRLCLRNITFGHEKPTVDLSGFLFDELLPRVGLWLIVGDAGSCKSLLALYVTTCLATKRRLVAFDPEEIIKNPNLGLASQKAGALLLIGEDYPWFHRRAKAAYDALEENDDKALLEWIYGGHLPIVSADVRYLSSLEDVRHIIAQASNHFATMSTTGYPLCYIVIDTLSAACDFQDENASRDMKQVYEWIDEVAHEYQCLIAVLTHPAKNSKGRKGRPKGSLEGEARAAVIWHLTKTAKFIRAKVTKGRNGFHEGRHFDFKLHKSGNDAWLLPVLSEESKDNATIKSVRVPNPTGHTAADKEVMNAIADLEMEERMITKRALLAKLVIANAAKTPVEQKSESALTQQVTRAVAKFVKQGLLKLSRKSGRTKVYSYVPPASSKIDYIALAQTTELKLKRQSGELQEMLDKPHLA